MIVPFTDFGLFALIPGSDGLAEIAVDLGRANAALGLAIGSAIIVED